MEIRRARAEDAPHIQALIVQLGYERPIEDLRASLADLAHRPTDTVLVAVENGKTLGMMSLHCAPMLQFSQPVARITTLVVHQDARGQGLGRTLVDHAADLATRAGCGTLELTTGLHRTEAQAFYKAIGFTASALKLQRALLS